jgi:glycosyltransferase involved in cell wall biosynthesis
VAPPRDPRWPAGAETTFAFVGRADREKGVEVLLEAWRASGLTMPAAALALVGVGAKPHLHDRGRPTRLPAGAFGLHPVEPVELRNAYDASDVLVLPSIPTRTFREPWGLVVNEAMNRGLAVIASDAVGAAAGGLVRDGETGLIVPAGDSGALARALVLLANDAPLRARMGAAGSSTVSAYSQDAWAAGFSQALSSLELSRSPSFSPASVGSVG